MNKLTVLKGKLFIILIVAFILHDSVRFQIETRKNLAASLNASVRVPWLNHMWRTINAPPPMAGEQLEANTGMQTFKLWSRNNKFVFAVWLVSMSSLWPLLMSSHSIIEVPFL